jgi:taurine dehydrogenase small subunit
MKTLAPLSTFVNAYGHMACCHTRGVGERDTAAEVEAEIERYNEAWNAHDVDAIVAQHAPGMVFENHTAGERVEGDAVRDHIARIFENWPDLAFRGRRLYARDGLVVNEWTATATDREGRRLEWDGVDVFPFEDGLITRKDVYSSSHTPRVLTG